MGKPINLAELGYATLTVEVLSNWDKGTASP